jgi:cytochrome c oxidase assembly protein subunit 15
MPALYKQAMPFDVKDFRSMPATDRAGSPANRRLVANWLFIVAGMILVMIVLGGVTRLTGSGLSIMEWAPFRGTLPPMSDAEWQRLFTLYKEIPQYALINQGFGLAGFKQIFWLEWIHRLWGRLIGIAFLLPLIMFWMTGRVEKRLRPRLVLLFILGGLQGAVGWFMVASGFFPDSTAVSPYRLVVHLVFALILYAAIVWTGLSVLRSPAPRTPAANRPLLRLAAACTGLVALTIVAGGFTAGTHAGFDYNTFPLMAGSLVPDGYARLTPFVRNITENIAAVQFDHRLLATLTLFAGAGALAIALTHRLERPVRIALLAFSGAIAVQYCLGVATLVLVVPPSLAATHQAVAILVLTASIVSLHMLRHAPADRAV